VNVKRDCFTRGEYVRRPIKANERATCRWCGATPRPRHPLYEIRWERDDRPNADNYVGAYCTWACFAYYQNITLPV